MSPLTPPSHQSASPNALSAPTIRSEDARKNATGHAILMAQTQPVAFRSGRRAAESKPPSGGYSSSDGRGRPRVFPRGPKAGERLTQPQTEPPEPNPAPLAIQPADTLSGPISAHQNFCSWQPLLPADGSASNGALEVQPNAASKLRFSCIVCRPAFPQLRPPHWLLDEP